MWSLLHGNACAFHSHGVLCPEPGTPLHLLPWGGGAWWAAQQGWGASRDLSQPIAWVPASHRGLRLMMLWGQSGWAQMLHPTQDAGIGLPPRSCGCFSCCFADIHEFYDFTLRSAPLQPPSLDARRSTARQQHEASEPSSTVTFGEPQNLPEVKAALARYCRARPCTFLHQREARGTGGCWPLQPSQLTPRVFPHLLCHSLSH